MEEYTSKVNGGRLNFMRMEHIVVADTCVHVAGYLVARGCPRFESVLILI